MSQPAYFVFDAVIHDATVMQPYMQNVAASYHAFGGELLALGGDLQVVEGQAPAGQLVLLRFPDRASASAWYASSDYQALIPHRQAGATCDAWLLSGTAISAD